MEWFEAATLLADVLSVPTIMLIFGWAFMKKPPKDINGFYGYRTTMSMKNQDTWEFAHRVCGRVWWRVGWVLSALSVALLCAVQLDWPLGILVLVAEGTALIATIFPVERALKKTFDKDGKRLKLLDDKEDLP